MIWKTMTLLSSIYIYIYIFLKTIFFNSKNMFDKLLTENNYWKFVLEISCFLKINLGCFLLFFIIFWVIIKK